MVNPNSLISIQNSKTSKKEKLYSKKDKQKIKDILVYENQFPDSGSEKNIIKPR
jgi:hypothetical protein